MPFNVTGNPAMSIPTGFSASGLPLSMQIVGRAFDESMVLRIGAALEAATGLSARRRPALAQG
jgi:aspartyl-tRNA(Asn)/glutamyl-tRNA(Gln) amidotransferase subunit A